MNQAVAHIVKRASAVMPLISIAFNFPLSASHMVEGAD